MKIKALVGSSFVFWSLSASAAPLPPTVVCYDAGSLGGRKGPAVTIEITETRSVIKMQGVPRPEEGKVLRSEEWAAGNTVFVVETDGAKSLINVDTSSGVVKVSIKDSDGGDAINLSTAYCEASAR